MDNTKKHNLNVPYLFYLLMQRHTCPICNKITKHKEVDRFEVEDKGWGINDNHIGVITLHTCTACDYSQQTFDVREQRHEETIDTCIRSHIIQNSFHQQTYNQAGN